MTRASLAWSCEEKPLTNPAVLRTVCGSEALTEIADALDAQWAAHDRVPETIRIQLGIAVGEIAANIIEHAAHGEPVALEVEVHTRADRVEVRFTDYGKSAEINLDGVGFPDDFAERGRGLAICKAALAGLTYRHSGGRNHWTLVSHRFG